MAYKTAIASFLFSCCNNFWWCLNNVAKGIARDELPYVMHMLNEVVRSELHETIISGHNMDSTCLPVRKVSISKNICRRNYTRNTPLPIPVAII
ncbi:MAG: aminoglycoside 6-adenylyltransferase [Saccharofermentanales bacterium]